MINKQLEQIKSLIAEIEDIEQNKAPSTDSEKQIEWVFFRLGKLLKSLDANIKHPSRKKSYSAIARNAGSSIQDILREIETWRKYNILPEYYDRMD